MSDMDKIPTQDKYENALERGMGLHKKIRELGELNEVVYEDLILLINTSSYVGKLAFGQVRNVKSAEFPEVNCKVTWDKLASKYAPHTALPFLKRKSEFQKRTLESIKKDPDECVSNLEGPRIQMNKFCLKGSITNEDL